MKPKLKQFRVNAGMTQAKLAAAAGVSQPNYHRWEAGAASIPDEKLRKLASLLNTSPDALLGKHPPIDAGFYNDSVSEDINYYGEVSVHFTGGGPPLLLSISDGSFRRLHNELQTNPAFVTVESLANQTVVIRTKAIADLYLCSEAYDYCGPNGKVFRDYPDHVSIQMPDPRDWEIVEALETDDTEDFDPANVTRVREQIMITDEQYDKLIADGRIKPEDLEKERKKNQEETDRILDLARAIQYQLSSGKRRRVSACEPEVVFNAFHELTDFDGGDPSDDLICLPAEGWHQTIFMNKTALDYVVIPTHKYIQGRIEADSEDLDSLEGTPKPARKNKPV